MRGGHEGGEKGEGEEVLRSVCVDMPPIENVRSPLSYLVCQTAAAPWRVGSRVTYVARERERESESEMFV